MADLNRGKRCPKMTYDNITYSLVYADLENQSSLVNSRLEYPSYLKFNVPFEYGCGS